GTSNAAGAWHQHHRHQRPPLFQPDPALVYLPARIVDAAPHTARTKFGLWPGPASDVFCLGLCGLGRGLALSLDCSRINFVFAGPLCDLCLVQSGLSAARYTLGFIRLGADLALDLASAN